MTPNKNILILHGWESNPREHWYQSAKEKFEALGYNVVTPEMPGAFFPKLEEWLKVLDNLKLDETWTVIGHSLGGVTVLRYLESAQKPIKHAVLIATPENSQNLGAIANFFEKPFDFEKIKKNCPKFDLIYEDCDLAAPLEHGENLGKHLFGKLHAVRGFTHCGLLDLELLESIVMK